MSDKTPARHIASTLAEAVVAGPLDEDATVLRCAAVLGRRWRWLRPLVRHIRGACGDTVRAKQRDVVRLILSNGGFQRATGKHNISVDSMGKIRAEMVAHPRFAGSEALPEITSEGELANWLGLRHQHLAWLADLAGLERKAIAAATRRYTYRLHRKRSGELRLIEVPRSRLKSIQRRILADVFNQIPPHAAAHGFRRARSVASFAQPHVSRRVVLKMDLREFFPSVSLSRVRALLRTVGYPETVACLLAALCTNSTPDDVWPTTTEDPRCVDRGRWKFGHPHLPQGAPTSPAIANLCAYRLDCRLTALAATATARYTRYADDLAFSGDEHFARKVNSFRHHVAAVVLDEAFCVNFRKTRIMHQASRQSIAGVVVNDRPNIRRQDFDRLKAILHNCIQHGPDSQNLAQHPDFRAHLQGKVAYVGQLNPAKGAKLQDLFERIPWDSVT